MFALVCDTLENLTEKLSRAHGNFYSLLILQSNRLKRVILRDSRGTWLILG